jgi:hypothetical protein
VSGYASSSKTSAAVGLGTLCCLLEDRVCGMEGSTHILSANEGKRNATERRTEKLFECIARSEGVGFRCRGLHVRKSSLKFAEGTETSCLLLPNYFASLQYSYIFYSKWNSLFCFYIYIIFSMAISSPGHVYFALLLLSGFFPNRLSVGSTNTTVAT